MLGILKAIDDWIKEMIIEGITGNLTAMFGDVNSKVGEIATQVGQTPQGWNASVFGMIRNLSEVVVMPIAGIIITYVLCLELITMVLEKNSFSDNVDSFAFFKYVFKAAIAVFIVAHTFDITMGIFDLAQSVISSAAGVITGQTSVDINAAIESMDLMEYGKAELLMLLLETFIVSFGMKIMGILITVILYGRMIEIYLTCSVAPIPMATITHKEFGSMGQNYLKGLFALGFQGFFLMLCVGIYAVMVNSMIITNNIHTAIFSVAAYTVMLCTAILKTGSLAKSIFNAS